MTTPRLATLLALLALGASACGGAATGYEATTDAPPDAAALLARTFSPEQRIASGKLDLKVDAELTGTGTGDGPAKVHVSGPFAQSKAGLPQFRLDADAEAAGRSVQAGAAFDGRAASVSYAGTDYTVPAALVDQLAEASGADGQAGVAVLDLDPRAWLKDAKVTGEARVGDAETVEISGKVDVPRMLDDVDTALQQLGDLGLQPGAGIPAPLSAEDRRNALETIERIDVTVSTGKQDQRLRRLQVDLVLDDAKSDAGAAIGVDLSLTEVNEPQTISVPSGRPLQELTAQFAPLR